MEAMSGVVATTFSFASAVAVSSDRTDKNVNIDFIKSESVGAMSAKEEFELQPDRVFIAKMFAVIVIVLEADLGEFAWVKSQIGRNARALTTKNILGVESACVSIDPFATKTSDPSRLEAPKQLRIEAPIPESFSGQTCGQIFASFEALIKRLG